MDEAERLMDEAEWWASQDPEPLLHFLGRRASDRRLRLFGIACCRRVWDRLRDPRSRRAVEQAEAFADGLLSRDDLAQACRDAAAAADPSDFAKVIAFDVATNPPWQENIFHVVSISGNAASAAAGGPPWDDAWMAARRPELAWQAEVIHDIFGGVFHTVDLFRARLVDPAWLSPAVTALARGMYDSRDFAAMPVLADALQDRGCDDADILVHCRGSGPHTRGCWVVDRLLRRE
jgi:hypothetical protein